MSSYFNQVSSLNPKVWLRFNETAGTPSNSGSLTTTFAGITNWKSGASYPPPLLNENTDVDGRSVYFDGYQGYTLAPWNNFEVFNDKSFSIELWFKASTLALNSPANLYHFLGSNGTLSLHMLGSDQSVSNRGKLVFTFPTSTNPNLSYQTTTAYNDNKWHHLVFAYNTTSRKIYIDGGLVDSITIQTPSTFNFDSYNYTEDRPGVKSIGGRNFYGDNTSQILTIDGFKGWIDEFALYDYELTAAQVNANFVAGSAVYFSDIPGTASALMVDPTLIVDYIETHPPMTADASFPLPNQTSYPEMLVAKMETYNLEGWLKFDNNEYNYGTGGTIRGLFVDGSAAIGLPGVCGMYAGRSSSSVFDGAISLDDPDNNIISKINDKVFSLGVWFKIPSTAGASNKRVFHMAGSSLPARIEIFVDTNGYIQFQYRTSAGANNYTGSTNLKDDTWHYAAMRVDNSDVRYYLDGVEVSALTVTGTRSTAFVLGFRNIPADGSGDTSPYYVSNFYVAGHTEIDATDIAEIWDVGNQTLPIQAYAEMPQSTVQFNNAYNFKVQDLAANIDLRYDNATGNTPNLGLAGILNYSEFNFNLGTFQGTKLNPTKNRYAYYIDDKDDVINISSPFDGSDNTNTYNLFARFNTLTTGEQWYAQIGDSFDPNLFSGYVIGADSDGPFFMGVPNTSDNSTWTTYHTNDTTLFDSYHLYTIVRDGSTAKFYIDGKLFDTYTPTGDDIINGINLNAKDYMNLSGWDTSVVSHTYQGWYLDEFQTFDYALSAQEVFELWQSVEIDNADDVSSTFVMPTLEAGFGPTLSVDEAIASAELVDPVLSAETNELADHLEAFAEFTMPNYGTTVNIDANYGHTAATADALFHDPQFQIGDFHSADHMDASAEMVHPLSISGGQISVSPCIAGPAILVEPGIVTIKGAQVFAEPARAEAILPLPPAYVQLSDDKWFATLVEGHSDRAIEAVQTVGTGTNLPNQLTVDIIKGGFLTFFNEFNTDLTTTTTINSIQSEIPAYFFKKEQDVEFDANGVLIPLDTSKTSSPARAPRGTNLTTPRMGVGYFDNYERKAVRIENIEFPFPGTTTQNSERPYNLEFSIKTTKKDQVLAYGYKTQTYGYGRKMGVVGLSNGKIYLTEDSSQRYSTGLRNLFALSAPHPKNFVNRAQYLLSKTDIADGQWHHVIIQQGYNDNRTQIWIDGKLDRQIGARSDVGSFASSTPGLDGTNTVRPYILGFNSNDPLLYSDFETSGWNFYPGRFLTSQQVLINHLAYLKYEPVKAEPMIGRITIGQDNIGQGNRSRMLLLYWWRNPVGYNQFINTRTNPLTTGYDGNNSPFKPEDLIDDPKKPPLDWYGWDVFPIGIVKPSATDIAKPDNIGNGVYLDIENGRTRMLDLQKDLDLSQFDMVMFANYPTTSAQLDEYIREELVDEYFNVTEKDIYADFLKSLRKAVDSGMSLLVQHDQLARDLGIYDRVERIPIYSELDVNVFEGSDPRAIETTSKFWDYANNKPLASPAYSTDYALGAYYPDWSNNMRHRVINTIEYLTDDPTYIWTDTAYYQNSDSINFGAPSRRWDKYEYKINGLQPGDEFIFGNPANQTALGNSRARQTSLLAIPFDAIKAGKIITAQPEKYYKGNEYVDNPYRNYAHSIALSPGDVLNGTAVGGKIFVSISEVFWDATTEERTVDLYTDYWVDLIYNLGEFGLKQSEGGTGAAEAKVAELKAKPYFRSILPSLSEEHNAHRTYWSSNGDLVITSYEGGDPTGIFLGAIFGIGAERLNKIAKSRRTLLGFERARDALGRFASGGGGNGTLFFQIKSSRIADTANVYVPNLFTRGFMWLSDRIRLTGQVYRAQAMEADARLQLALPVVDKDININVSVMLSNATIGGNITGTVSIIAKDTLLTTLPLIATAIMPDLGKEVFADKITATARIPEPGIFTYSIEDVILKIENYEPILYIRGDKIT